MNIFKGEKKVKGIKTRLSQNIRVKKNRLTKIADRVTGIDDYPTSLKDGTVPLTDKNIESTFKKFIKQHKGTFGVESKNLKMISAKNVNRKWYVKYGQFHKGIPVHNTSVNIESSENGKVSSYAANYQPNIDVETEPKIDLEKAVLVAKKTYKKKEAKILNVTESTLLIYPEHKDETVTYHLAWKFLLGSVTANPEIEKYFFVDALNGKILQSYTAHFPGAEVSGTVRGEVYPINPTNTVSTLPINHGIVEITGAGSTVTNHSGSYTQYVPWWWEIFGDRKATFKLEGPYASVQNSDGSGYSVSKPCVSSSPCDQTWTATDRDHINLFYHMNLYRDWLKSELGYSWVNLDGTSRFNAQVNYNFANAYAGNPMKFGYDNYARSSDVIYHECTHNILHHEYGAYIGYPETHIEAYAMDEGFADYFSCSFTNSSIMGEGCFGYPRDLDNSDQYPGKASYNIEGHTGGKIIGGAAWDFRQRLIAYHGAHGARLADQLLLEAHQILSMYPRKYYFSDPNESNLLTAMYRAADIDNNLFNGFPYFNDIQRAFHGHGLLQAVLESTDSFDFSTNTLGWLGGGDLYYSGGKFWANNLGQNGVVDLGNIGNVDLSTVTIPSTGFTRFGVNAVKDHTYVSIAQDGEIGSHIAFRVEDIAADKSTVSIRYLYRLNPNRFIANLNSKEIHRENCHWVSLMATSNKSLCHSLEDVAEKIKDHGYNGCHFCLRRYDTDTLSIHKVHQNLDEDLEA